MKYLKFKDGSKMPVIGLGTWKSSPGKVKDALQNAIQFGYRHIDCAAVYQNEKEVGEGIKAGLASAGIPREELWVTSKLWNNAHKKEDVLPALKKSLADLQLNYLDLYLIHWPVVFKSNIEGFPKNEEDFLALDEVPIIETWNAMIEAKNQGLIKNIGVSNFSIKKLEDLIDQTEDFPTVNQVELHPYLHQDELLQFCQSHKIHLTAYSPLGSGDRTPQMKADDEPSLLENEIVLKIANKHKCSPAQVLLKWSVERGTSVIPKSTNAQRIKENLKSIDVNLTGEDMNELKTLDKHYRYVNGKFFETTSKYHNIYDD